MKLTTLAIVPFARIATAFPPNTDTPLFYFVSSSTNALGTRFLSSSTTLTDVPNYQPLRTVGGAGGYSTLTGSGPIGQFYFSQGKLVAVPPPGSSTIQKPLIGAIPSSAGCTTYGPLGFTQGSSSDKCAKYESFYIQSESQLGAQLSFNLLGGFYACGSNQDVSRLLAFGLQPVFISNKVWHMDSSSSIPFTITCDPINLWTVPV